MVSPSRVFSAALSAIVVGLAASAGGQWPDAAKRAIGDVSRQLSVSQLLSQQPLTTTLRDALPDVPFLDGHQPLRYLPMTHLPAASHGWQLRPGSWAYASQSYCLKAGTRGPSQGNGYTAAPLKGPQADTIRAILRNSAREVDIPQSDIQLLLWRIIARARFDQLPARQKAVALRLLTVEQIAGLNAVSLNVLPGAALDRAISSASPEVRRVLSAEAEMRRLLDSGQATYEQIERLAVLPPDPDDQQDRLVRGRWVYHPAGYFIRYRATTYSGTTTQIDVPGQIVIETDTQDRIVSLADSDGTRALRLAYDDRPADPCPDDKQVLAHLVRSVSYEVPDPSAPGGRQSVEWRDRTVVLTGLPSSGKVRPNLLSWQYDTAREVTRSTDALLAAAGHGREPAPARARLANLVHLENALDLMVAQKRDARPWTDGHLDLVMDAWQFEVCRAAGACGAASGPPALHDGSQADWALRASRTASPRAVGWRALTSSGATPAFPAAARRVASRVAGSGSGHSDSGQDGGPAFDPSSTLAQPGTDGKQRLGQSARTSPSGEQPYVYDGDWSVGQGAYPHRIVAGHGTNTTRTPEAEANWEQKRKYMACVDSGGSLCWFRY